MGEGSKKIAGGRTKFPERKKAHEVRRRKPQGPGGPPRGSTRRGPNYGEVSGGWGGKNSLRLSEKARESSRTSIHSYGKRNGILSSRVAPRGLGSKRRDPGSEFKGGVRYVEKWN